MSVPRVHVTGDVPAAIEAAIAESFVRATAPSDADGILALINSRIDNEYLERAGPQLRIVANYGVGVDNIDLAAAARRGIVVTNTPDVLTETTAELAITLTLSLLRRVTEGDRFLRAGRTWGFGLEFMLGEGSTGSASRSSARAASAARRHGSQRHSAPSRSWSARRARAGAPRCGHGEHPLPTDAGDEAPDRRARRWR